MVERVHATSSPGVTLDSGVFRREADFSRIIIIFHRMHLNSETQKCAKTHDQTFENDASSSAGRFDVGSNGGSGSMSCRICLDVADEQDLISPCLCSGTSQVVHRACLDVWRCSRSHRDAFTKCGVCLFEYKLKRGRVSQMSRRCISVMLVGKGLFSLLVIQVWLLGVGSIIALANFEILRPILDISCGSCGQDCENSFWKRVSLCWPIYYGIALAASLASLSAISLIGSCIFPGRHRRGILPVEEDGICMTCPDDCLMGLDDADETCCAIIMVVLIIFGIFFVIAFLVALVQRSWQKKLRREELRELCLRYRIVDLPLSSVEELDAALQQQLTEEVGVALQRVGA